jgi:nitroreductase
MIHNHPVSNETLIYQLQWRYATKQFDSARKISEADWSVIAQALTLTPSSFGVQPWKFFVVSDPALRAQLPAMSWGQTQPVDCSHYVVLAARTEYVSADLDRYFSRIAELRGVPVDSLAGFRKMVAGFAQKSAAEGWQSSWLAYQVYIALGNLMTSAAMLGIDTCPMEGFDPQRYDELLGLKARGYRPVVCCALGYRAASDKYAALPKVRYPAADVLETI